MERAVLARLVNTFLTLEVFVQIAVRLIPPIEIGHVLIPRGVGLIHGIGQLTREKCELPIDILYIIAKLVSEGTVKLRTNGVVRRVA